MTEVAGYYYEFMIWFYFLPCWNSAKRALPESGTRHPDTPIHHLCLAPEDDIGSISISQTNIYIINMQPQYNVHLCLWFVCRQKNSKILVHCKMGVSRSASTVNKMLQIILNFLVSLESDAKNKMCLLSQLKFFNSNFAWIFHSTENIL